MGFQSQVNQTLATGAAASYAAAQTETKKADATMASVQELDKQNVEKNESELARSTEEEESAKEWQDTKTSDYAKAANSAYSYDGDKRNKEYRQLKDDLDTATVELDIARSMAADASKAKAMAETSMKNAKDLSAHRKKLELQYKQKIAGASGALGQAKAAAEYSKAAGEFGKKYGGDR